MKEMEKDVKFYFSIIKSKLFKKLENLIISLIKI